MKILHSIYDHTGNPWVAGGGAFRVREIYGRFSPRHEITVLCGKYPGARDYSEGNVRYRFVGTGSKNYVLSTLCYAVRAAGYLRANAREAHVIVEDFAPYNPVFSFLWCRDAVIQLHQREGLRHLKKYAILGILFFLIEKYYHLFFRNVVTISDMSRKKYGLKGKARVAVVQNGVAPVLLSGGDADGDHILFLGRLHINQKGLDTLRDAMNLTHCRLVIAGSGKDEGKVRALFSDAVAAGRAEFAGFVSGKEKADLIRKCLFMVVPSRYEGQPLTVIESAACGKPVIVSDIPELRYAVDEGFGLAFRANDAGDLAGKIECLLRDVSLRREMGERAKKYAERFTWDEMAGEYEKFLAASAKCAREGDK